MYAPTIFDQFKSALDTCEGEACAQTPQLLPQAAQVPQALQVHRVNKVFKGNRVNKVFLETLVMPELE